MPKDWQEIPGWFDWEPLYRREVERAAPGAVFVEVGAWLGRSCACLAQLAQAAGKPLALYAVDHCRADPEDPHYGAAVRAAGGNSAGALVQHLLEAGVLDDVTLIVADSVRAARLFGPESIDFAFLDAGHDYASVRADLCAWWPRLKPGGVLAGHDYSPHWPGVVQAVHEGFRMGADDYPLRCPLAPSCWGIRKDPGPPAA